MGGSEEPSNKGIDASAGALIWVQRKNGTWWPGEIQGPDEVPVSCLLSPKSGAPVKLIGREDLSLEWYDLEKSKHVKAFRCGEFDNSIEKAKASTAKLAKKVNYARREDAILLALKLEGKTESVNATSHKKAELDSELELSKSGVSFEDTDHLSASKEQSSHEKWKKNPSDGGTKGVKRMKGLNALGSQVVAAAYPHRSRKKRNCQKPLTKVLNRKNIKKLKKKGSSNKLVEVPLIKEEPQSAGSPILSSISQKSHIEAVLSDEVNESTSGVAAELDSSIINLPRATIQWNSKGKRNSRYTVKIIHEKDEDKHMDIDDDKSDGYLLKKLSGCWTGLNQKPQIPDELLLVQKRSVPYRKSRSTLNPKYDPLEFMLCDQDDVDDSLYDVKVEVESLSCCRPQHVPFISLMSKSSGRPITGYPLEVELLKNGLSEKLTVGKKQSGRIGRKRRKSLKLLKKKKGGALMKKTRKLSTLNSLGNSKKFKKEMDDEEDEKDRMQIKFKKSSGVVCCVPLKVVFSRLNAALG